MIRIPCRGVLFDLDGVLVDSTPAVERVWTGWALEHGLNPQEVVRRAHGRPSLATLRELLPGPDPYLKGADSLAVAPADCLVVEDAPAGVHAGKAAGARVIALRTTMAEDELREAGADWIVQDCSALSQDPAATDGLLSILLRKEL